ncbi:alpha/beta hydrolase family protein [Flavisphingomonas formosensis]|uniref:hypothetical protein n=1 Tax=Flavisphingomonas formosensis TaxID=861534 RepID=UPI0012F85D67|nr:hypothetical protein [Sphingomonas formosensis]
MALGLSACATNSDQTRPPRNPTAARFGGLNKPMSLRSTGSFFVGGRKATFTTLEAGLYRGGPVSVDQMYVEYLIPEAVTGPSIVMIHGATLTGKTYETTPDGRMGWYEYFARQGFPSYVVDQVGRGRSGFDQAGFNNVRGKIAPPESQRNFRRIADDLAWVRFRFGPAAGVSFPDSQFPAEAAAPLAMQSVPDIQPDPASDRANYTALADLAGRLQDSILIGHSQSGRFPFEVALLHPGGIKGVVAIEPGGCNSDGYSAGQISALAKVPILVVFGDHLDAPQSVGPNWLPFFKDCQAFVARVNAAGGKATLLHTPDMGIRGNSHMIMQDRNNLEIADLLISWVYRSVLKR